MSEIIGSTYEIIGKLGSGGGGVVYLANHLRLGKRVVLKADKRSTNTRAVLLRREVDVLKELHHPYIPQVYDYFIENDTSYTVMDLIDGESLDKLLKKETKFPQAKVIFWTKQLLEALAYLHSPTHGDPPKGYVHSDVKPANIMIRPDGNICLIDFNISLAIGIETVIGKSDGYSSPEHYGIDYSFNKKNTAYSSEKTNAKIDKTEIADDKTEIADDKTEVADDKTEAVGNTTEILENYDKRSASVSVSTNNNLNISSNYSSSAKKIIVPDARSDIYSVGATMYHLLSGKRPAKYATDVEPLSEKEFSPLLVKIVSKAMAPDPAMRFASADEMLNEINSLWKNDARVKRRKKQLAAAISAFAMFFVIAGAAIFTGLKQMERLQAAYVLSANSAEALSEGNVRSAVDLAMQALVDEPKLFDVPYTAEAQLALTNALGVYDLSDSFSAYEVIELSSAPFRTKISPDGKKLFVCYAYEMAIYDIASGEKLRSFPTQDSALCEVEFIDENRIIYAGKDGLTAYDISSDETLWQADPATAIAVSDDGLIAAAVNGNSDVINFYDINSGELISFRELYGKHLNVPENDNFADACRDVFELNGDGSVLAVSLDGGALMMLDIYDELNDLIIYESSDYLNFQGKFAGDIFAFSAYGNSEPIFGMANYITAEYIGEITEKDPVEIIKYNDKLYISINDELFLIDENTLEQTRVAYTENKNITAFDVSDKFVVTASSEGSSISYRETASIINEQIGGETDFVKITDEYAVFAGRNSPTVQILRLNDHKDKCIAEYDPKISHSEARIISDGSGIVLFDIYSITIIDMEGNIIASVKLPEPEKIYDQQYISARDELEVTYYSGKIVSYSAKSGNAVSEKETSPPDESLDVEYETESFIVKAPLHGVPEVYDKISGEKIADLNSEDHLTYITEIDKYIIAQYISTEGEIYGILMNKKCAPIAVIPYLCDIWDNKFICDLPSGNIKAVKIYELDELKDAAKTTELSGNA